MNRLKCSNLERLRGPSSAGRHSRQDAGAVCAQRCSAECRLVCRRWPGGLPPRPPLLTHEGVAPRDFVEKHHGRKVGVSVPRCLNRQPARVCVCGGGTAGAQRSAGNGHPQKRVRLCIRRATGAGVGAAGAPHGRPARPCASWHAGVGRPGAHTVARMWGVAHMPWPQRERCRGCHRGHGHGAQGDHQGACTEPTLLTLRSQTRGAPALSRPCASAPRCAPSCRWAAAAAGGPCAGRSRRPGTGDRRARGRQHQCACQAGATGQRVEQAQAQVGSCMPAAYHHCTRVCQDHPTLSLPPAGPPGTPADPR